MKLGDLLDQLNGIHGVFEPLDGEDVDVYMTKGDGTRWEPTVTLGYDGDQAVITLSPVRPS